MVRQPWLKLPRRLAVAACFGALIGFTLVALPFARVPIGPHPTVIVFLGTAFATTETLTAILLVWRAVDTDDAPLGYLAAAYAMSATIFLANLVVVVVGGSVLGKHGAAAPWLSIGWHIGWCALALTFALAPERATRRPVVPAVAALAAAIAFCAFAIGVPLPPLIDARNVTTPLGYVGLAVMCALGLATIAAVLLRPGRKLASWVGVAALALTLHAALNIFGETRFSLAYYLARVLDSVNGAVVLIALITAFGGALRKADVLSQTERRLRLLLEGLPQLVWTALPDGSTDWCNSRWTEYTGKPVDAAVDWSSLAHPDDVATVTQRLRRSLENGEPFEAEHRLRRSDGTFEWFLARMIPERGDRGEIVRWLGSLTNIDAQKREQYRSLRVARVMQQAFLPEVLPQIPGVTLDALYEPAEREALIGGDWYDVVRLDESRLLITCGDVTGHGLDAAILAGRFRHTMAFVSVEDPDPARILERVNRAAVTQWDAIATAVVAIADLSCGMMRYAIAGHPPPFIARADGDEFLPSGGLPLGTSPDASYETYAIDLRDDTLVVFYTDGLLEFERDLLGAFDRLRAAARATLERSSRSSALAIKQHVLDGAPPRDDIAILVLEVTDAEHRRRPSMQPLSKTWRFHSHDAASARDARHAVARFLSELADPSGSLYEAELIVGESLANTVQHAPGLVEVTVDWTGEHAKLAVCDSGPGMGGPAERALPEIMRESGRGLFIIEALAPDLHVRDIPGVGLELRCTLPVRRNEPVPAVVEI